MAHLADVAAMVALIHFEQQDTDAIGAGEFGRSFGWIGHAHEGS
jgi:hypothetical protein